MAKLDYNKIITACGTMCKRCTQVDGTYHGSVYWADKLIRFFESNTAITSVTIPVYINAPVMSEGEAEIGRDGSLVIRRA